MSSYHSKWHAGPSQRQVFKYVSLNLHTHFIIRLWIVFMKNRKEVWAGRPSVLSSIWRMYDMKANLRCHAYVSRYINHGTAATITTVGLILPVLGWALSLTMQLAWRFPNHNKKTTYVRTGFDYCYFQQGNHCAQQGFYPSRILRDSPVF